MHFNILLDLHLLAHHPASHLINVVLKIPAYFFELLSHVVAQVLVVILDIIESVLVL